MMLICIKQIYWIGELVSLTPKQYESLEPVKSFISCLVKAGKKLKFANSKAYSRYFEKGFLKLLNI